MIKKNILKIVYLIRAILYLPFRLIILTGNLYSSFLKIIDKRNHDTFWQEIMQKSINSNISEKIKISENKDIKFYCPSKIASFRIKTFFTKEPETIDWMNEYGSGNKILYDIGANMGIYTIYYAKKFDAKVYAFEPNFKNLDLLTKNIRLNLVEKQATIIPNPISDKFLISNFFQLRPDAGEASATFNDKKIIEELLKKNINNDSIEYRTLGLSLDNLIELNLLERPDLIKIDVDGNELDIINGFKRTINKLKNISILIETQAKNSKENLESELEKCGLKKIKQIRENSIWEK